MTKVVINACYGGFSLSEAGIRRYAELKGLTLYPEKDERFRLVNYWTVPKDQRPKILTREEWHEASDEERRASNAAWSDCQLYDRDLKRDDPILVRVVEELGARADGPCASLEIVEVPDDVEWEVEEYDGNEWVAERHRTWE